MQTVRTPAPLSQITQCTEGARGSRCRMRDVLRAVSSTVVFAGVVEFEEKICGQDTHICAGTGDVCNPGLRNAGISWPQQGTLCLGRGCPPGRGSGTYWDTGKDHLANFLRYLTATARSFGQGAVIVICSPVTGCGSWSFSACNAGRLINGRSV